ncbi:MAG: MraW methylase family-domain-containing protein [Benjaminiella poitrasii]|nr:MAG: MraW methylase family-domain-containing protein [Benjaminiella poitrasii]
MRYLSLIRQGFRTRCYSTTTNELPYTKIHVPVMLNEVLTHLEPKDDELYCDMTFGDGGYTKVMIDTCDCKVVAVDQDPTAYAKALELSKLKPYKDRLFPILGKFGSIYETVQRKFDHLKAPCFDAIVMDIGVSSGQLESAKRGFSYKLDGPLDMRMFSRGQEETSKEFHEENELLRKSISAYEIVNYFSREQIANIIYEFGGDRLSRKIASAIVLARQKDPIESTTELASIIQKACPQPRWQRGHDDVLRNSAARTFQALRIYINDELGELKKGLTASERLLKPEGRLAVVTFHSLEDRVVKNFMFHCAGKRFISDAAQNQFRLKRAAHREHKKALKEGKEEEEEDGLIGNNLVKQIDVPFSPSFELCTKHVIQPSEHELSQNARSRSAKLRVAKRTAAIEALDPFDFKKQ